MLSEFVRDHREEIIARCRARVAGRMVPRPPPLELEHGIPLFLRELEQTLACELRRRQILSSIISNLLQNAFRTP